MLTFIISFLVTLLLIKLLYPLALKYSLVDSPNVRKLHTGHIPLIGGLAIFLSFLLQSFFLANPLVELIPMLLAFTLIVLVGVIDDLKDLCFKIRLLIQSIATFVMLFYADLSLNSLGDLVGIGSIHLGVLIIPFTVFAVIGSINAFNMMDGIDGLAASLALVALVGCYISLGAEGGMYSDLLLILIASLFAFLLINLYAQQKIFMGDAGSMLLGFAIAWFAILFSQSEGGMQVFNPITALWLVAIPIMDTVCIMIRRVMKGQSPFLPDREHLHHIFLRAGYTDRQTLLIIVLISVLFASIGLIANHFQVAEWVMFISFGAVFIGYFYLLRHSWLLMRWLKLLHKPKYDA